jgi:signal transduction histidine kinase
MDLFIFAYAATDDYIDGILTNSFGNTGANGKPFKEFEPSGSLPVHLNIDKANVHTVALHFVDFVSFVPPHHLKSANWIRKYIAITLPEFRVGYLDFFRRHLIYKTILLAVNLVLCLLFWLLTFQNPGEKNLLLIAAASTAIAGIVYCDKPGEITSYNEFVAFVFASTLFVTLTLILSMVFMLRTFRIKIKVGSKVVMGLIMIVGFLRLFYNNIDLKIDLYLQITEISLAILFYFYYVMASWKRLKGAQWAVLAGIVLTTSFGLSYVINLQSGFTTTTFILYSGTFLCFPLSLAVYVATRFKEIIKEVYANAKQVVRLSEEKKEQALNQQAILQREVSRQTAELRTALENLKSTQAQLIQSEKMASLGELTAGIAHEIQNPLNFVNNFSQINYELIDEAHVAIKGSKTAEAIELLSNLRNNEVKIIEHGQRADAIVKSMMLHSRTGTGQKETVDINSLVKEYLRLSFQGHRTKDKTLHVDLNQELDENLGKAEIVPQDLGRVLLNLFNNAFYSVAEKRKLNLPGYEPTLWVSTRKSDSRILISVRDNGQGIPGKVIDKIFQPFFTTKPTGQGTGLGLSLAYDIIKAHGGQIKVESEDGKGTEFIVELPYNQY